MTTELRATGKHAWPSDKVGLAPDHNTAEWGLWIGRPMLGQWAFDVRRLLDALEASDETRPRETALIGVGPGGLVALVAAATDPRVTKVAAVGTLASFVSDEPFQGQRLGVIAPGIVKDVGDVAHLAALVAPRRVVIAGGVSGGGKPLDADRLRSAYRPAAHVWDLLGAKGGLTVLGGYGCRRGRRGTEVIIQRGRSQPYRVTVPSLDPRPPPARRERCSKTNKFHMN